MTTTENIDPGFTTFTSECPGEDLLRGMGENEDGTWTAMTYTQSKTFKTKGGAVRWLARKGYAPNGTKL